MSSKIASFSASAKRGSNIWFVSDTHFSHKNIIKYCNRPWDDTHQMNKDMVELWNDTVDPNDTVFHLGDFAMGNRSSVPSILDRLHGHIIFIPGNHDHAKTVKLFEQKFQYDTSSIFECKVNGQRIVMCHYAMRIWHKSHHGSWHLYGHSHNGLEEEPYGLSMDVGVDANAARGFGYRPISFAEVKSVMDQRKKKIIDHHDSSTRE